MTGLDVRFTGEIGYGTGYFDNAGVRAGAQAQAVDEFFQQILTGFAQRAETFQLAGIHFRIGENAAAPEALPLDFPGLQYAFSNGFRGFRLPAPHQRSCINGMHK